MQTFKRYLHETELSTLALELFLRSRAHLSKAAAKKAVEWYHSSSSNAPSLPDDGWDHLIDWADSVHTSTNPYVKSLHDLARGGVSLPLLVRGVLAKHFRLYQQSVNEGVLGDLAFSLGLRKEYGLTKEQAQEVIDWLRGDKDWEDLEYNTRDVFIGAWDPNTVDRHPGMSYSDHVMDEIHMALKKYQLDTRDLIGP